MVSSRLCFELCHFHMLSVRHMMRMRIPSIKYITVYKVTLKAWFSYIWSPHMKPYTVARKTAAHNVYIPQLSYSHTEIG